MKKKKKAKGTGIPKRKEIQNPENSEKPPTERKMKSSKISKPAKKDKIGNQFKKNEVVKKKLKKKKMDEE